MYLLMKWVAVLYLDGVPAGYRYKDESTDWYLDLGIAEANALFNGTKGVVCLTRDCNDEVYISQGRNPHSDIDLKPYKGIYMSDREIKAAKEKRFVKRNIRDKEISVISALPIQEVNALKAKVKGMYNDILDAHGIAIYSIIDSCWYGEELSKGCIHFAIKLYEKYTVHDQNSGIIPIMCKKLSENYDCYVRMRPKGDQWYDVYVYKTEPGKR